MSNQPEALRLADAIDPLKRYRLDNLTCAAAAACLRHQRAEIEALKAERDEDRRREYGYSQQTVDALTKERDAMRAELHLVLDEWNELVKASGSPTNGGAIGHVRALRAERDALLVALKLIAATDPVDAALDPERAARIAYAAIPKAEGGGNG